MIWQFFLCRILQEHELIPPPQVPVCIQDLLKREKERVAEIDCGCLGRLRKHEIQPPYAIRSFFEKNL